MVLYLLAQGVEHGPCALLFTVSEEVGLKGRPRWTPVGWRGLRPIEHGWVPLRPGHCRFGRGPAGDPVRTLERRAAAGTEGWHIALTGGTGRPLGDDIHRGRLNAVQTLASFLQDRAADWEVAGDSPAARPTTPFPPRPRRCWSLPAGQEGLCRTGWPP